MRSMSVAMGLDEDDRMTTEETHAMLDAMKSDAIVKDTLKLIEWPVVCSYVARFCSTKEGKRRMTGEFGLPVPETKEDSERLLLETNAIVELERKKGVGLDFGGIGDVRKNLQYCGKGGVIGGAELLEIAGVIAAAKRLRKQVLDGFNGGIEGDERGILEEIIGDVVLHPEVEAMIYDAIDDFGMVRDSASEGLRKVRERYRSTSEEIQLILQGIISRQGNVLQERIVTQRYDRFVVPVKAGMKSSVPGIVQDTSATGSTLFIEPKAVQEQNTQLRRLVKKEKEEVEKVLCEICGKVGNAHEDLVKLYETLVRLDMANARAKHSIRLGAVEPRFVDEDRPTDEVVPGLLSLRSARHPILVWKELDAKSRGRVPSNIAGHGDAKEESNVVPIDFQVRKKVRAAIITGPNTGGKTVSLKTLAINSIMARAGLFVLADEPAQLPYFDRVLADIGDEQSIEQSLSTFSGHIERVKRILSAVTPSSLVLLDEVGSGTDPSEGAALGIALLRHLSTRARFTFATTHHGELKTLKYVDSEGRFENASMEFDDERMAPTYRLIWGIPGRSNALSIAKRLGFPEEIIEGAKASLSGSSSEDVNTVIAALERQRLEAEKYTEEIRAKLAETQKLREHAVRKVESLKEAEEKLRQKQTEKIESEMSLARKEIAGVVRKMQAEGTSQAAARARSEIDELSGRLSPTVIESKPSEFEPRPGDMVRIDRLGQTPVEILSLSNNKTEVVVSFGGMKVKIKRSDITSLEGQKPTKPQRIDPANTLGPPKPIVVRQLSNTCDVRGETLEFALDKVENMMASAMITFGALWIVHGHGTGALRRGIRAHLRTHPRVSSFEDAHQRDGGTGATVVYLKDV